MKNHVVIACLALLIGLCSCVKQPNFPIEPHIEFKSLSDTLVRLPNTGTAVDSVQFTLSFTDGDGDFGVPEGLTDTTTCPNCVCTNHATDSLAMQVKSVNLFYYQYVSGFDDSCLSIPGIATSYIPVAKKYPALQGDIIFSISFECPGTGTADTQRYSFFIKDRAGHFSNRVLSPPIIVDCN
ncbi:MAG: hypothetical protein JST83_19110 [Bacteroidetes bacterium]|nr:hypothetical protein [Bacteroidota bacterium]